MKVTKYYLISHRVYIFCKQCDSYVFDYNEFLAIQIRSVCWSNNAKGVKHTQNLA